MDRRSLPQQVRDQLRQLIQDRRLLPGQPLAPEVELATQMGVGRSTIREALKLLEQEGVVDVQPGRGRFVSVLSGQLIERPITHFQSITDLLRDLGYEATSRVLECRDAGASAEEAAELHFDVATPVIRLARVRYLTAAPIVYMEETLPRSFVGALHVDWTGSVTEVLAERGHRPVTSRAHVRAVVLAEKVRKRIGSAAGAPWIEITETDFDPRGEPCLYAKNYLRGDLFAFNFLRRSET